MSSLMKITKIPAAGNTRLKPMAGPISIVKKAEKGNKIELRKVPINRKKKLSKGGDCGCGGGKVRIKIAKGGKIKKGAIHSYQIGGALPPSPLNPASPGIPSPGNIKGQSLDSLRVNQIKQPNTTDLTPSAPRYGKKPPMLGYKPASIPRIQGSVLGSVNKLIRDRAWKRKAALGNKKQSIQASQLDALATKPNYNF